MCIPVAGSTKRRGRSRSARIVVAESHSRPYASVASRRQCRPLARCPAPFTSVYDYLIFSLVPRSTVPNYYFIIFIVQTIKIVICRGFFVFFFFYTFGRCAGGKKKKNRFRISRAPDESDRGKQLRRPDRGRSRRAANRW